MLRIQGFLSLRFFIFFLVLLVGTLNAQQCGRTMGTGIWLAGGMLISLLIILSMIYIISGLEIVRSIFEPNYIRGIIQEKLGEVGLNFLIVFFFAALFSSSVIGGKDFFGLANTLPSAFSENFLNNNLPRLAENDNSPALISSEIYGSLTPEQEQEILLKDRPLYLRAARYYIYYMRMMAIFSALLMNFFSGMFNLISSLTMYIRIKMVGFSLSLGTALNPILHMISFLVKGVNLSLGHWILQGFVLSFIECYSLQIILPLGIIMRVFSPTKGFGDILISFSIGMLFIYPLMLNLNAVHAKLIYGDNTPERNISPESISQTVIVKTAVTMAIMFSFQTIISSIAASASSNQSLDDLINLSSSSNNKLWFFSIKAIRNKLIKATHTEKFFEVLNRITPYLQSGFTLVLWLFLNWWIFTIISSAFFAVFAYVSQFVIIMSFVWPAINIYVTLLSIKAIAKFLGTEFNLAGIARML